MKPDRWLATVLFTDIVGSTQKAAELGDRRWRELLETHHALARREIARHGGRELNMTGDGFLATFDVPERALRCACAVRDAVRQLGLEIRAGLHTGEVELVGRSVGGLGVHIGARVAALAAPGEVLVSSTVRDMAAGSGFEFSEHGSHLLKGVPGEWKLFAVTGEPVRLPVAGFWTRAREARLPRLLLIYMAASAVVLWGTALLRDELQFPPWVFPAAVLLLLIGLISLSATAWVQSHPLTAGRAEREEVPGSWELDLGEMRRSVARGRLPHLTWGRSILGGVMAFSLLFGLAGLYVLIQDRGRTFSPGEARAAPGRALAVLPFRVVGPEMELWREGMVDLLSTNLDGAAGIRSIAPRTVLSRWRTTVGEGTEPSDPQALQVARGVGAKYALVGSMVALGGEVRLTAQIHDLEEGEVLGEAQVRGAPDSIPVLVDRLSLEILRTALAREAEALPEVDLRRVTTGSLPALKAYLAGEQNFRRSRWDEAIADFTRAVEADSTFALALYRISLAHGWIAGFSPQSVAYSERAGRLIDRLPEREALLLRGNAELDRGDLAAIRTLEELTTLYPDDAEAWYMLGDAHWHLGASALHPREKFKEAMQRALELDPSFGPAYIHLIWEPFALADSAEASRLIRSYRQIDSTSAGAVGFAAAYALAWGDADARASALAALDTLSTDALVQTSAALNRSTDLWEARLRVAAALLDRRHPLDERQAAQWDVVRVHFNRGRLREAREAALAVPGEEPYGPQGARSLLTVNLYGYPDSSTTRRAAAALAANPTLPERVLLGMAAADEGRWQDVEVQIRALESAAGLQARGDTSSAENTTDALDPSVLAEVLQAYAATRRGDVGGGLRDMRAALPRIPGVCPGDFCGLHQGLRYEIGRLLLASGDARQAIPYLESVSFSYVLPVPSQFYLGKAHEVLGNLEQARLHYERFVRWWKDCDPELRPMWEEGRQALQRLTGVRKL